MKQTIPKKLASGVAAAAMTLSLLPAAALAADSEYSASGATGSAFTDSGIAAEDGSYTGYKISGTDLTIQDSGTLSSPATTPTAPSPSKRAPPASRSCWTA